MGHSASAQCPLLLTSSQAPASAGDRISYFVRAALKRLGAAASAVSHDPGTRSSTFAAAARAARRGRELRPGKTLSLAPAQSPGATHPDPTQKGGWGYYYVRGSVAPLPGPVRALPGPSTDHTSS